MTGGVAGTSGLAGLRRFLADAPAPPPVREVCELCATPVPAEHPHLVHVTDRRMVCACGPCGFLFSNPGAGEYRRIPDRVLIDPDHAVSDAVWDALKIPVGIAFFLHNSVRATVVACYPGPAGATESELELEAFAAGIGAGPLAAQLEPDVEALLVRRGGAGRTGGDAECLLVPVDACYRLVGLVRRRWRGFDGGSEAWEAIDGFFAELRERAVEVRRTGPTTPAAGPPSGAGPAGRPGAGEV
ncbi:MAG: DUF5947 family protein [Pseudonocardia sp.]